MTLPLARPRARTVPRVALTLGALLASVAACATTEPARGELDGTWLLVELEGARPLERVPVLLTIENDQRIFGTGGVNRFFGSIERGRAQELQAIGLASTRMAGPADALAQEVRILELLQTADRAHRGGGRLVLERGGRRVLVFEPLE